MDAEDFINLADAMLNLRADRRVPLRWSEERLLAQQMVDGASLLLVGRDGLSLSHADHHIDLRLYSVRQYPQAWAG